MQRRNFIRTTGIVCTLSGAMGSSLIWDLLKGNPSIQFPEDFSEKGKSQIIKLYKDIKQDVDHDSNKDKWVRKMLQPKKILEQKEFFGGDFTTTFTNVLGNTVKVTSVNKKSQIKFS